MHLLFKGVKLLEIVLGFSFVSYVLGREVRAFAIADIDLSVPGSLRATNVGREPGAPIMSAKHVDLGTHTVEPCVLHGDHLPDLGHVPRGKELLLTVSHVYPVLIVVVVVSWEFVSVRTRGSVGTRYLIARPRTEHIC